MGVCRTINGPIGVDSSQASLKGAEDGALMEFYDRLPQCLGHPEAKNGRWQLLDCHSTWPGDKNWRQFIASVLALCRLNLNHKA